MRSETSRETRETKELTGEHGCDFIYLKADERENEITEITVVHQVNNAVLKPCLRYLLVTSVLSESHPRAKAQKS